MDVTGKKIVCESISNSRIFKTPPMDVEPHEKSFGWFLYEKMQEHGKKIAQICTNTGKEETYADLLQRIIRVAIALKNIAGITRTDIVSVCTLNHMNSMVPLAAAQMIGAKVAAFDPSLSLEDTQHLMEQTKPTIIFVEQNALNLIETAVKAAGLDIKIVIFDDIISDKYENFKDYLKVSPEEQDFRPIPADSLLDTAYIFFSSGTTGLAKGICCSHYGLLVAAKNNSLVDPNIRMILSFASPYWISATLLFTFAVEFGMARIVIPTFQTENVWHIIEKYKVDFIFMAPNQAFDCVNIKTKDSDASSVKQILVGGAAISRENMLKLIDTFPNSAVMQGYGQTEICGCATFMHDWIDQEKRLEKVASCGLPINGLTYKIVDNDTGEVVGPNKVGELRLKTKSQMNGYNNADSSTAWDEDGFLRTGDLMYYDEEYYFYFVDRIKEMFKYKSWHIQPAVVEKVICQHPAVLKSLVFGVPHPSDGDHPAAVVILKNGYENVTSNEILQFVNGKVIDRQKLRGGLKIIKEFPLTPSGKIQRRKIRDLFVNNAL